MAAPEPRIGYDIIADKERTFYIYTLETVNGTPVFRKVRQFLTEKEAREELKKMLK